MGGKHKKVTVGYWYHPAFHMGISLGPIDALLEIRGGDLTAWSGSMTASGTFTVSAPNLWGGEKDQGGIAGDFDLMMGEPTQQPNAYLTQTFGDQQPAWRGLTSIVFKGGRYGAMNPYPQKISYKGLKVTHGWDGDPGDGSACWYPAKAAVQLTATGPNYQNFLGTIDIDGTDALTAAGGSDVITPSGPGWTVHFYRNTAGPHIAWSKWDADVNPSAGDPGGLPWLNTFEVTPASGATQEIWPERYATAAEADEAAQASPAQITGASSYTIWLLDSPPADNRGGLSLGVSESPPGSLVAMNPAHALYYARTQQHMGREPAANMDDASHKAAADWFYSQGFGICWDYDPSQESVHAFIARIEKVSGCSQTRSPVDGKWYLDVANGVYDLNSLPILTDDDILDFQRQPTTLDSAVNSVSVQYFDPQQKADVTTPPVEALALINAFGTIHQDVTYKEIPTGDLAMRVAQRDLLHTVTPTNGFHLTTTRKTYAWRRGTYFRLQAPRHGVADMVCILGDIDTGTLRSGAVQITAAQDVYSLPVTSFVQQEPGVDTRPSPVPVAIIHQMAFEAPYIEVIRSLSRADLATLPTDVGYLMTIAADPATSRDYTVRVSTDGGATYAGADRGPWCPTALVVEGDTLNAAVRTDFTVTGATRLSDVVVGSAALWDLEIVRIDAIDVDAGTLTLGRGCADTVPMVHAVNSRIWFFDGFTGTDGTEYTNGEAIDVKLLTNTGSAQLDPALAAPLELIFDQRQFRPYPPANLRVNGDVYPSAVIEPLTLAWVHRDRVTQADQLVDTSQASVGPEDGTTYTVRTYLHDVLTSTMSDIAGLTASPDPGGFGNVRIEIDAVRGGVASRAPLTATFDYRSSLAIATESPIKLPTGKAGSVQLAASGGTEPYSWSVDPTTPLPAGVTMDSSGLISGDGTSAEGDTSCNFICGDAAGVQVTKEITIAVTTLLISARYWRLYITANNGNASLTSIDEIELRAEIGGADLTTPSTPVTASDEFNSESPSNIVDDDFSAPESWSSATGSPFPHWIAVDLGSSQPVAELALWPQNRSDLLDRAPKDFELQYADSLNGPWTALISVIGATGWTAGIPKTFTP